MRTIGAAPAASRAAGAAALPRPDNHRRRRWTLFPVPSICLILVFFVLPFLLNVPFAFSSWSGYSSEIANVGFDNFEILSQLGIIQNSIRITVIYAVICMVVQNSVSISLALALKERSRTNSFFRSIFFVPVLISPLAAGYLWHAIVAANGPLNAFIGIFSPGFSYVWLGHSTTALIIVAFIDGWKWSGIATLVYIAGLNSIPRDIIEAATIDGASAWQRFHRVTFPLLAPAVTFNVVTTLIGALSAYDIVASTTSGGPGTATQTLNAAAVEQFGQSYFGTASALSLTVTALVVLVAIPLVVWLRRREVTL